MDFGGIKWGRQGNVQCHGREGKGGKGITLHFGSGCNQLLLPAALQRSTEKMENGVAFQPLLAGAANSEFRPGFCSQPSLMGCSFINCHHFYSPFVLQVISSRAGRAGIPKSQDFWEGFARWADKTEGTKPMFSLRNQNKCYKCNSLNDAVEKWNKAIWLL